MSKSTSKDDIIGKEALQVISSEYDMIFSAEKRVADFILSNPHQAVEMNVSELAKASGVSDATVVRMCHHIGYTGYYQFRIALSRDLGKMQQRAELSREDKDAVSRVFNKYAETLIAVGKRIDEETVWNCVDLLKSANMVHIIAVGNATNISRYMGFRLERMGIRSVYDDMPEYFINHLNLARKDDVVVAISKSGISKQIIRGLELAKDKDLKTIVITACSQSPVSLLADYLLVSGGEQEPFGISRGYVYISEMSVVEALLSFLVNEDELRAEAGDVPEMILSDNKI